MAAAKLIGVDPEKQYFCISKEYATVIEGENTMTQNLAHSGTRSKCTAVMKWFQGLPYSTQLSTSTTSIQYFWAHFY